MMCWILLESINLTYQFSGFPFKSENMVNKMLIYFEYFELFDFAHSDICDTHSRALFFFFKDTQISLGCRNIATLTRTD